MSSKTNKVEGASSSSKREQDAPATKEPAKPALVPKLRFPEFRDQEGWDNKCLNEVCSAITQGGTPNTSVAEFWNGAVNWLTPAEMGKSECPFVETTERKITEEGLKNCSSALLPINSVILSTRAPIGHLAINKTPMAINQGCKGLIPSDELDFHFLYFSLVASKRVLNDLGSGNTFKELSGSALKSFSTAFPSFPEQQKIAECLSSVDELIGAESRKLDALKNHKKGLMQQLFPGAPTSSSARMENADGDVGAPSKTLPRLRFPEFQDAGEWKIRIVSQLAKVTTGAKDTQNKVEDGRYPFFVRSQTVERINSFSYDGEAILTSGDGVGVGKNFHYIKGKFDFHQRVYCIYDFTKDVSGMFFYLYFSEHFGERVMRMSAKNSVDSVRMAMITEMPIVLPSLPEQQRIADCLSSLDGLIAAQTQKIEALKTHKKGLM
jgi:type I restriction enzyme S subunit